MQFKDLSFRQKIEEVIACAAFVAFVVLLMFLPDLTRL